MARPFANKSQQVKTTQQEQATPVSNEKVSQNKKWQITQFCIIDTITKGQLEYLPEQILDENDVTKETLEFLQQLAYIKRV